MGNCEVWGPDSDARLSAVGRRFRAREMGRRYVRDRRTKKADSGKINRGREGESGGLKKRREKEGKRGDKRGVWLD